MPFTRTQSILKIFLPKRCFIYLHGFANRGYRMWCKILDEMYYFSSSSYYLLKRDSRNVRRIKTVYSIRSYTMVGRTGLLATYDIANGVENNTIDGCFIECGVAKGGCSALMAIVANDNKSGRKMWLFDSFEGLPRYTNEDESTIEKNPGHDRSNGVLREGYCLGTYEEVSKLMFSTLRLNKENVFLVKGWFQDTLPRYKEKVGKVSFLRLDSDWYESTKCCLENLYDNVAIGGYIFIDDYYLPGCKKAVDEFLLQKSINVQFIFDGRGGAYFMKP